MMRVSWTNESTPHAGIVASFVSEGGTVFAVIVEKSSIHLVNVYKLRFESWVE